MIQCAAKNRGFVDLPIIIPTTLPANSPNLGSVTCRTQNARMGSRRVSSRPSRATRRASRKMSSCINANEVAGRTVCLGVSDVFYAICSPKDVIIRDALILLDVFRMAYSSHPLCESLSTSHFRSSPLYSPHLPPKPPPTQHSPF